MKLLEQLCAIHSPTGEEHRVRDFILQFVQQNQKSWKCKPTIISDIQDNLILVFGKPEYAVFSHMDTTGFTLSYANKLLPIGSPFCEKNLRLKQQVSEIIYEARKNEDYYFLQTHEDIPLGTTFTFANAFSESTEKVQSPYLDNRLGIYILLEVAKTIKNGILAFTSFEEHFSGGVEKVLHSIYRDNNVKQVLINDVTSTSEGIQTGTGIVISLRDAVIPRRNLIDRMVEFAKQKEIHFQLEVEDKGASDGAIVQRSWFPFDWCFLGIAVEHMHSTKEIANVHDINTLIKFYKTLLF